MKPNIFIILGMPRTGTTFLYHTLKNHPSIYLPYRKESLYFSVNYHKGLDWFCSLYKDLPASSIGADIGPVYFLDPLSVERIMEFDPKVRVILGVRDPIEYAISQYNQIKAFGWPLSSIKEMVKSYRWNLSPEAYIDIHFDKEFISKRIDELRRVFLDNLLVYDYRLLKQSPLQILKAIEAFVDIPSYFDDHNFQNIAINASSRRNILFVNNILKNQEVLDAIYTILPQGIIRGLRNLFDRLSVKAKSSVVLKPSDEELAYLIKFFSEDRQYVDKLFSAHPIQLGSGKPFAPMTLSGQPIRQT